MNKLPSKPQLGISGRRIAEITLPFCRLPHPQTVSTFSGPVFPSIRNHKKRGTLDPENNLLFDSNRTPRWALFWSHGIGAAAHPKGWTIAHVWTCSQDPKAYTNLANLVLMPECFGSLSDKDGPMGCFLRYHAYSVYGWKPDGFQRPEKPEGFDDIDWQYFEPIENAESFVHSRLMSLKNVNAKILRSLVGFE